MPGKLLAALMLGVTLLLAAAPAATAETRTLKLYFLHTRERAEITYKRNGRYIQSGLNEINRFLRDWRRNEPTKMDPQLLDLLWEAYRRSGSRDYIHVVSAYRAPETNAMLRKRSSGVAKKSQHMLGKAIDFYLPDVKLSKLRNIGLQMQVGGVGYYPRSGSPFVHFDVASVRHWPRMSRKELASVFPDGKTLHVPTDGKPLPGYEQALASYKARERSGGSVQIANDSGGGNRGRGLLAALFGGGADEEEDNAETQVASAPRPAQAVQQEPERPGTILAALPARQLPVPREAPRPQVDVGSPPPAEAPVADAAPEEGTPSDAEEAAPTQVAALDVPVPSSRPDYTPPQPEAVQADSGVVPAETATAFATPEPGPETTVDSSDVIAEILAAQKDQPFDPGAEDGGVMPSYLPASASGSARTKPEYVLASLPVEPEFSAVGERREDFAPASVENEQPVRSSDSPRLALLSNDSGKSPAAVIAGSVKTTEKGPKPGPRDAVSGRRPTVLPAEAIVAELVLSRESMFDNASHTKLPAFSSEVTEVPKTVYTAGFEKDSPVADARRFSGRAVTFLSVAKFE